MLQWLQNKLLKRLLILFLLFTFFKVFQLMMDLGYISLSGNIGHLIELIINLLIMLLAVTIFMRITEGRVFRTMSAQFDAEQSILLTKMYEGSLYAIGLLVILKGSGIQLGNISLMLGLAATGVALAIRDILSSFLSWYIVLSKRPFRLGDYIKIGEDIAGEVLRIGTFFITLKDPNRPGESKVPNSFLLNRPLHNMGRSRMVTVLKVSMRRVPTDILDRIKVIKELIISETGEEPEVRIEGDSLSLMMVIKYGVNAHGSDEIHTPLPAFIHHENADIMRSFGAEEKE